MGVQVNAPAFLELVAEDAELEQLGTGFTFTEGPIWNPDGFLLFSDMPGDVRRRWDPDGGVSEVANPSNKGNGMTIDNDGRLVVCEHVTSSVVRMDPDGRGGGREVLATHYEGKELNSPNDVVVKSDGAIYFTDPTYGRMPDESLLYINDTDRAHIRVFDVQADGTLANSHVLADGIGSGKLEIGDLVDGMKLDERGNVWVTGPGGVCVFNPEGEHIGTVEVPENVGNVNWGGPDWNWLFIPATSSVYRIECKVSGNRLPYMK
jgi:gluconolactonase